MLILTRRVGEQVILTYPGQPPVTITVNAVQGRRCVLAFEADPAIGIVRPEAKRTLPLPVAKAG